MSDKPVKLHQYPGSEIDVQWDSRLCIHISECGNAKGELFVMGRDPWCTPDISSKEEVREIVERCPTGALSYVDKQGNREKPAVENSAVVSCNGPLFISGDLELEGAPQDMPGVLFRIALCRCGESANKPFCDNSHQKAGFTDYGSVGESGTGLSEKGGKLSIKPLPNGPLLVKGNLTIHSGSGRTAWQGSDAALCRCGASRNKPFCDGSHKDAGFKSLEGSG